MTEEGTELERLPLRDLERLEEGPCEASGFASGYATPPSTSGRPVPTINWGEKRMSPGDLKVYMLWCYDLLQLQSMSCARWCRLHDARLCRG